MIFGLLFCGILLSYIYVLFKKYNTSEKDIYDKDHNVYGKVKYNYLSIIVIIIAGVSWVMNIGWYRVLLVLPMILHTILFYFSNRSYNRYKNKVSKYMNFVNYSIYITYLLFYIFLPDGGDLADSYSVFFGLVKNEIFLNIAAYISIYSLVINIVLIIIRIIYIQIFKQKFKIKTNNIEF